MFKPLSFKCCPLIRMFKVFQASVGKWTLLNSYDHSLDFFAVSKVPSRLRTACKTSSQVLNLLSHDIFIFSVKS